MDALARLIHQERSTEVLELTGISVLSNDPAVRRAALQGLDEHGAAERVISLIRSWREEGSLTALAGAMNAEQRMRAAEIEAAFVARQPLASAIPGNAGAARPSMPPWWRSLFSKQERLRVLPQSLQEMAAKFAGLQPPATVRPSQGTSSGERILTTICGACDDAIQALRSGLDVDGRPITRTEIADGLQRVVSDGRSNLVMYRMASVLTPQGLRLFEEYLGQLERLARRI
jgi:hypothetical protein